MMVAVLEFNYNEHDLQYLSLTFYNGWNDQVFFAREDILNTIMMFALGLVLEHRHFLRTLCQFSEPIILRIKYVHIFTPNGGYHL